MMPASIQIVIVNWRTGDLLRECVSSIEKADWSGLILDELTIVDNDSSDGSLAGVSQISLPLHVISGQGNIGFSRACNLGAAECRSDLILFLNPDTRLEVDTVRRATTRYDEMFEDGRGILGVQLRDALGGISASCSRFPTLSQIATKAFGLSAVLPGVFETNLMTEWDHQDSSFVDYVMGAFVLCRRQVFNELNGFDERFFVYYEEVDLMYRASQIGILTYFNADTFAVHVGQGSTENVKDVRLFYSWRSRIQYARVHFSTPSSWVVVLLTFAVEPWVRVLHAIIQLKGHDVLNTLSGYRRLLGHVGHAARGRD